MPFKYREQNQVGLAGERTLDELFAPWFDIARTDKETNISGVDRIFRARVDPRYYWWVEYKTDWKTAQTGNVFIETQSVDGSHGRTPKPGWAHKAVADTLVYFCPQLQRAYIVRFAKLREALPEWEQRFTSGKAKNPDYFTHGLKVPVREFARIADSTAIVDDVN